MFTGKILKTLCYNDQQKIEELSFILQHVLFKNRFDREDYRRMLYIGFNNVAKLEQYVGEDFCELYSNLYILSCSQSYKTNTLQEDFIFLPFLKLINISLVYLTKFVEFCGKIRNFKFIKRIKRNETSSLFYGFICYDAIRDENVLCPVFFNYILRYGYYFYLYLRNPRLIEVYFKEFRKDK